MLKAVKVGDKINFDAEKVNGQFAASLSLVMPALRANADISRRKNDARQGRATAFTCAIFCAWMTFKLHASTCYLGSCPRMEL
jgi:hypothetical protein